MSNGRPRRLDLKLRRWVIERARMEQGLLMKMVHVTVPWHRDALINAKMLRTLRYYRRFYRNNPTEQA